MSVLEPVPLASCDSVNTSLCKAFATGIHTVTSRSLRLTMGSLVCPSRSAPRGLSTVQTAPLLGFGLVEPLLGCCERTLFKLASYGYMYICIMYNCIYVYKHKSY